MSHGGEEKKIENNFRMESMKNKNPIVVQTLRILIGMVVCLGLMLGVYALIGKFDLFVLFGGIVGTILAVGNFFFMAIGLFNLTDGTSAEKIKLRTQSSFLVRTLAVGGLAAVAIYFGGCDPLATLLPLLFVRFVIMVEQFILKSNTKKEDKTDGI